MGEAAAPPLRSRWEEAQARAVAGRERYAQLLRERAADLTMTAAEKKTKPQPARNDDVIAPPVHGSPALSRSRLAGRPCDVPMHDRVLKFAARSQDAGLPPAWRSCGGSSSVSLCPSDEEYQAVTDYFRQSIQRGNIRDPEIVSLERLQNSEAYTRYAPGGSEKETVMFHGCRTAANETSIVQTGFQVRKCVSGGANYGTWFAYNADYSNSGYVYVEPAGVRHIFVCVVSDRYVVQENAIMRVVAQDCAYPLWLLCYKCKGSPPPPANFPPARVLASQITVKLVSPVVRRKRKRNPTVKVFHEVRAGRWVQFTVGSSA